MYTCICGHTDSDIKIHEANCQIYRNTLKLFKHFIEDLYTEKDTIEQLITTVEKNKDKIHPYILNKLDFTDKNCQSFQWKCVRQVLKKIGKYTPDFQSRNSKQKKTMMENHGVINAGQLKTNPIHEANKRDIVKNVRLFDEFESYRKKVAGKQKINKRNIKQDIRYCFYTGIKFADEVTNSVNPNDPMKRTLEHRTPIIVCYLNGVSVEAASQADNLCYTSRIVNQIKSNTDEISFLSIAKAIRERLIYEGFESNQTGPEIYIV